MRTSSVAVLIVLSAGLLAQGCGSAPEPVAGSSLRTLTASEVRKALVDNSLYRRGSEWWRAWEYVRFHRADGTMTGRVWWSGGEEVATGAWEVGTDDLYCRTWNNHWGGGRRGCFRVSRTGVTLVPDHVSGARGDADRYTYRLLPGNPYGF